MTNVETCKRPSEQGFTLVELAIVMVIIGLLIGGVLKGQELIGNARITATISQLRSVDAALNAFQDKYNALPGDITTPGTKLPNCTAAPCNVTGDANARIGNAAGAAQVPAAANESGVVFVHLSSADMLSGINPIGSSPTFGNMLPSIKTGNGGFYITNYPVAPLATMIAQRHYAVINGSVVAPTATTGTLTGVQAFQLDTKLDDGGPSSGSVQVTGTDCTAGAPAAYNTTGIGTCALFSRVLN